MARLLREAEENAVGMIRVAPGRARTSWSSLLLERETVDGSEVYRIVGRPVPERREEMTVAPRAVASADARSEG